MSELAIMRQPSCNRIRSHHCQACSLILSGSRNWDAVEVALDRAFVEGRARWQTVRALPRQPRSGAQPRLLRPGPLASVMLSAPTIRRFPKAGAPADLLRQVRPQVDGAVWLQNRDELLSDNSQKITGVRSHSGSRHCCQWGCIPPPRHGANPETESSNRNRCSVYPAGQPWPYRFDRPLI